MSPLVVLLSVSVPCLEPLVCKSQELSLGSVQIRALPRRYLCCETQMELREWFATFLFVQVPAQGGVPGGFPCGEWVCFVTI